MSRETDFAAALVREKNERITRLESDVEVLREALRPFAAAADARKQKGLAGSVCFLQGDLIAAREALSRISSRSEADA